MRSFGRFAFFLPDPRFLRGPANNVVETGRNVFGREWPFTGNFTLFSGEMQ